ncbi:DUF1697 domain-containing protein [Deinococcus alpinitundrae]|uniref:DUF1697 domain-containing protein n=1 Tax=Deinococcus alpinitundrae TaxID=468913 RepID=UPI001379B5A0|nr:DUF1697 domain-containing protein [Deinococcus alpinitundrae]
MTLLKTIALLRGVNVGGHRRMPMLRLKSVFEALELGEVQTYIQSGNVVFGGETGSAELEAAIEQAFGFPVPVILRNAEQWREVMIHNPYSVQAAVDGSKVHLAFLDAPLPAAGLDALLAFRGADEWHLSGPELYLHTPEGLGRSRLSQIVHPTNLGVGVTTRNWRTVLKLGALVGIEKQ